MTFSVYVVACMHIHAAHAKCATPEDSRYLLYLVQAKLGVPMVMHNRQWSITSDYIKNEPFAWYTDKKAAVPKVPPN